MGAKTPETALTTGNELGECWPMGGTKGKLVVELANLVQVSSVTLMHIHPKLAPKGGDVSSALRTFKVFAYPEPVEEVEEQGTKTKKKLVYPDKVEVVGGTFDKNAGCMTFPVTNPLNASSGGGDGGVRHVELEVLSNHGREELTCLYRFMVHGEPAVVASTQQ